ncbi:uncharacterized protein LOC116202650 [Punica granatum]|uniref:DUF4228 domain-containing protein n=2 Tax=Punica granatum TaxID=22663 RepID=A0A218WJE1_PUNGR|nr:uncharacterized protein LOC116202650 [Punica granatum]OWM72954.1 hypothetical protein CDL15_Pgr001068 [Punica granatum]PKI70752.1 hypothetical protein CRG98_008844 [Punica granatum]
MKNTIRCCISCILPCGILDVIRIVHSNGRVEEISGKIQASEIMKLYPKHVLKRPSSKASDDGLVPRIVVVPPDAELQRGKIYFLMPIAPTSSSASSVKSRSRSSRKRRTQGSAAADSNMKSDFLVSDQYLSEIMSEKISTQKDQRRGRVGVWRPHLESISETLYDG